MRISDWSSDVCSSDLLIRGQHERREGISAPPREPNAFLLPGRCVQSLRARGEDFAAVLGDPDAVLELGGERAVAGPRGPAVGEHLARLFPGVDHRPAPQDPPDPKTVL